MVLVSIFTVTQKQTIKKPHSPSFSPLHLRFIYILIKLVYEKIKILFLRMLSRLLREIQKHDL